MGFEMKNSGAGEQSGVANLNEFNNSNTWFEDFELLVYRYSHLGISADLASLSLVEMYGLFLFLRRLHENA